MQPFHVWFRGGNWRERLTCSSHQSWKLKIDETTILSNLKKKTDINSYRKNPGQQFQGKRFNPTNGDTTLRWHLSCPWIELICGITSTRKCWLCQSLVKGWYLPICFELEWWIFTKPKCYCDFLLSNTSIVYQVQMLRRFLFLEMYTIFLSKGFKWNSVKLKRFSTKWDSRICFCHPRYLPQWRELPTSQFRLQARHQQGSARCY